MDYRHYLSYRYNKYKKLIEDIEDLLIKDPNMAIMAHPSNIKSSMPIFNITYFVILKLVFNATTLSTILKDSKSPLTGTPCCIQVIINIPIK